MNRGLARHTQLVHFVDEAINISHPKELLDKWFRVKGFQVVNVLTRANEDHRTSGGGDRRQGTATLGVTVQLCDNYRTDIHLVTEGPGLKSKRPQGSCGLTGASEHAHLCLASLSNGRIHNEDSLIRLDRVRDLQHFLEERLLLLVPS